MTEAERGQPEQIPARWWRAYVLNRSTWTEAAWERALVLGLAQRLTARDMSAHKWTLTDAGLDLMAAGAESEATAGQPQQPARA